MHTQIKTDDYPQGILRYSNEIKLIELLNADMINQLVGQNVPFRSNGIAILLVKKGSLKITLDYNDYLLNENDMLIKLPEHIMQKIEAQKDFEGLALMIKKELLEDIAALLNKVLYSPNYMQVRLYPHCKLNADEIKILSDSISLIKSKIGAQSNAFQRDIIKCSILMMMLECENFIRLNQNQPSVANRREQILNAFLGLLIDNCRKEHKVEFYADKLFVTPQYLSLVLKDTSGKTAYQWIVDGIMTEAKILLKDANLNVQQISEILNFPDASSFGKFYKKQTGLSPFKYRNENRDNQKLF